MAPQVTIEALPELLKDDNKVKLAGIDVDGQLRGKLVSKKKFLSVAEAGFGFCSSSASAPETEPIERIRTGAMAILSERVSFIIAARAPHVGHRRI